MAFGIPGPDELGIGLFEIFYIHRCSLHTQQHGACMHHLNDIVSLTSTHSMLYLLVFAAFVSALRIHHRQFATPDATILCLPRIWASNLLLLLLLRVASCRRQFCHVVSRFPCVSVLCLPQQWQLVCILWYCLIFVTVCIFHVQTSSSLAYTICTEHASMTSICTSTL